MANAVTDSVRDHAELCIGGQVFIVIAVHLRSNGLEALLVDERMQMCGPKGVTVLHVQQHLGRSAGRHRVARGFDGAVVEGASRIGGEATPQIPVRLAWILVLVQSLGGSMPHVHVRTADRLAFPCRPHAR